MEKEKDILVLSGAYAGGIGAGLLTCSLAATHIQATYALAAAAGTAVFACTAMALRQLPRSWSRAAMLMLLTGLFCAVSEAIGSTFGSTGLFSGAERAAARLGALIDSIPYPSEDTAGLVKALTTGDRSGLSGTVRTAFRASGASHILALSGLHMGIIYMMIDAATRVLGRSPKAMAVRYFIVITCTGFYTVATGAGPSVVRAFLFILLSRTAVLLGRKASPARIFCCALMVQLALSPQVMKTIGFQLSYLAMAGIVFIHPLLSSLYPAGKAADPIRKIWEAASIAISCQAATAPLAWIRFGTFPKYLLITNILAMPLTTIFMVVSTSTIILSALGTCPQFLVLANDKVCSILVWILQTISTM